MANDRDQEMEEDRDDFDDIRHELNLDEDTIEDALKTYQKIKGNFKLEGKRMDWIACAIYASCRSRVTQTMGRSKAIEGNMVSLTRILRSCSISLTRFFNKMKNWMLMAKLSSDMHSKLDQLERNFNVTAVIFKKYKPIFEDIFKCVENKPCRFPSLVDPKKAKSKGLRKHGPLNSSDIFTFCWTLFVYIKSKYSQISDDLINSYHLLLVCLDYCYSNVLSFDNYKDIVNSSFYDALAKDLTTDPKSHNNDNRVSIIDTLCSKWQGIEIEVKQIKKHWFEPFLKALTEKDDLPQIKKGANGILDCLVVDQNYKYFKNAYENYVLTIGDFDECVFLSENASEELGTEELYTVDSNLESILLCRMQPPSAVGGRINHEQPNNFIHGTPLSSKEAIASRTPINKSVLLTPISSATHCISRLQSIVLHQKCEPSVDLAELLNKCATNPAEKIAKMISEMGEVYISAFANADGGKTDDSKMVIPRGDDLKYIVSSDTFPKRRLELATTFFYRVLEIILKDELRRAAKYPNADLRAALVRVIEQHVFLRSLFACSLEIVTYSYSPANRLFPWILDIYSGSEELKIHSFHFYKVIELIIRSEQQLSRELVKHLKTVEEKILEKYAWTADSPLWTLLKGCPGGVPSFEETLSGASPASKAALFNLAGRSVFSSPFTEPPSSEVLTAKKQLSFSNFGNEAGGQQLSTVQVSVAGALLPPQVLPNGVVVKTESDSDSAVSNNNKQAENVKAVNSSQQLKLFFRKVYNVAHHRLRDLTSRLAVKEELTQMMWTCLLHALKSHSELMCEHHLDQIIMCSVYCICKLNTSITFADIINEYRFQPQAVNHVYRHVLLSVREPLTEETEKNVKNTGDLIQFYNKFFIKRLTEAYIINFGPRQNTPLTLSPMPRRNNPLISPIQSPLRRVSDYVFVSPLRTPNGSCPLSPGRSHYRIQCTSSASNELKAINSMMMKSRVNSNGANGSNSGKRAVKRLQDDLEGDTFSGGSGKMPCLDRKINDIIVDRNQIRSSASVSGAEDSNDSLQFAVAAGSQQLHQLPGPALASMGIDIRVSPILSGLGASQQAPMSPSAANIRQVLNGMAVAPVSVLNAE